MAAVNHGYCGITNDIDIRMNQHKDEDFDIKDNKVFSVLCESKGIAVEVEHLMSSEFSITNKEQEDDEIYVGNGAMDSTRYVYLLSIG